MQVSDTRVPGSSSFQDNQTPIQVLKSNNMNIPLNSINQGNIN